MRNENLTTVPYHSHFAKKLSVITILHQQHIRVLPTDSFRVWMLLVADPHRMLVEAIFKNESENMTGVQFTEKRQPRNQLVYLNISQ